ncbi:MAG: MerR family transcriptional regulator [Proteobacteria bacterium]|nr:MerR family transcriptional regulator [Pseudomonadota bacterium]MBU1688362.1 MerR family transcriptional regulator [Pseudomonadota bacterium]
MVDVDPYDEIIPDKLYFKIGEVSQLVGVDTHVLRYWESEFKMIRPLRVKSQQRLYRRSDVKNLLLIKTLLYEKGFTIAGARKVLDERRGQGPVNTGRQADNIFFNSLKKELQEIKKLLDVDPE